MLGLPRRGGLGRAEEVVGVAADDLPYLGDVDERVTNETAAPAGSTCRIPVGVPWTRTGWPVAAQGDSTGAGAPIVTGNSSVSPRAPGPQVMATHPEAVLGRHQGRPQADQALASASHTQVNMDLCVQPDLPGGGENKRSNDYYDRMTGERKDAMTRRRLGRPPKSEGRDSRALLLEVAKDLFARNGFAGTSVRAVARAAGLSESGVYAHFASKQELFAEVLAEAGPRTILALLGAVDLDEDDPPAFVRELASRVVQLWDQPGFRRLTTISLRDGRLTEHATGSSLKSGIDEVRREVGKRFETWMRQGLVQASAPPEQLAWELFAPIAYVRLLYLHADAPPRERAAGRELARRHVDFFISNVFETTRHPTRGGRSSTSTASHSRTRSDAWDRSGLGRAR
jgi:AcrR family transcriptional regulator